MPNPLIYSKKRFLKNGNNKRMIKICGTKAKPANTKPNGSGCLNKNFLVCFSMKMHKLRKMRSLNGFCGTSDIICLNKLVGAALP